MGIRRDGRAQERQSKKGMLVSAAYDMRNEDLGSFRRRLNGGCLSQNDLERKNDVLITFKTAATNLYI